MLTLPPGWRMQRTDQGIEIYTQDNGVEITLVASHAPQVRPHERLLYLLAEALLKQRSAS